MNVIAVAVSIIRFKNKNHSHLNCREVIALILQRLCPTTISISNETGSSKHENKIRTYEGAKTSTFGRFLKKVNSGIITTLIKRRNFYQKPIPNGSLKVLNTLWEVYGVDYYSPEKPTLDEYYDISKQLSVLKHLLKWGNRDRNNQIIREFSRSIAAQAEKLPYVTKRVLKAANDCQFCTVLHEKKANPHVIDKFVLLIEIYKALAKSDNTQLVTFSWSNIFQIILFYNCKNKEQTLVYPNESVRELIEPNISAWRRPNYTSQLANIKLANQLVWFNMQLLSNLQHHIDPTTLALLILYDDSNLLSMYLESVEQKDPAIS